MVDIARIAPSLKLGCDGIWHSEAINPVSYPSHANAACFELEEDSFWFNHRNACIVAAIKTFPPSTRGPIYDIGGGNGFVSIGLMKAGFDVVLVEPGLAGALNGKKRGVPTVVQATTASAGFAAQSLEAVGLFDVIEHIKDDVAFLTSIRGLLKPGGRLYATVPASSLLWSVDDEVAGHFRRYTLSSLAAALKDAGFTPEFGTYIFRPLPLPILLLRATPSRLGRKRVAGDMSRARAEHKPGGRTASRVIDLLMRGEVKNIQARRRMRFGATCLARARTPACLPLQCGIDHSGSVTLMKPPPRRD
jgi:SAM-dependent methyltransferase